MTASATILKRSDASDPAFNDLIDEVSRRLQAGEADHIDTFLAEHPKYADAIQQLLPALQVLVDLSHSREASGAAPPIWGDNDIGTLGDFQIIREVGRGGMGVVYEATQISLHRRVALKVLPFAATMDPRHLQRFKNEALAAASLEHPHIVPVYGVGSERGVHFYAMKFIDGRPLTDIIRPPSEDPKVAPPDAETVPVARAATVPMPHDPGRFRCIAEWGIQAAEALEHAHSLGIVHRDVKPGNLMLDAAGKLWVTDFGLAKIATDAGVTMTGDLLGTLRYMSPEQALAKHGVIDHRTDVYALGATLFELLTGQPAVSGDDKQEVLRRIAFEEPVKPRVITPSIPRELETIVLKSMEKEVSQRYGSAKELADDLRRWVENKPIAARRKHAGDRLWKWARRRPAVAALTSLLFLSLLTLAVGATWTSAKLRMSADRARQQRDQARTAVDNMYSRVAEEWLAQKPRLQPLQHEFLLKALAYYESVGTDNDDPVEPWVRGQAFLRVGAIQTKLGAFAEAEVALKKATEILDSPEIGAEHEHLAGDAWARQCINYIQTARLPEAIDAGRRAVAIRRRLVANPQASVLTRIELGESTRILAAAMLRHGSPDAAAMFSEARSVFEAVTLAEPSNARGQLGLVNSMLDAGRIPYIRHEFPTALNEFNRGAALAEQLVKQHPNELNHWSSLSALQLSLGTIHYKLGQRPEALKALDRAKEILDRLTKEYPDMIEYRADLALVNNVRGHTLWEIGRKTEAIEAYGQSIQTKERMVAEFPQSADYRQDLIHSLSSLAEGLVQLQRIEDSQSMYRRAEQHAQHLVNHHQTEEFRTDLARIYTGLAAIELDRKKFTVALAEYERAIAVSMNPEILVPVIVFLASCPQADLRNPTRAVELAERVVNDLPQGKNSYRVLGEALFRAKRPTDAIAALEKAIQIAGETPSTIAMIAMCYWDLGKQPEAMRHLKRARELMTGDNAHSMKYIRWLDEATKHLGAEKTLPGERGVSTPR